MGNTVSRKRVCVKKVQVQDVEHVRIFYDENKYAGHPNRGGIWNFGDGEIVVAHLVKSVKYTDEGMEAPEGVKLWHPHDYTTMPGAGVILNHSFDNGRTWPESERTWIWHNDRYLEEILEWLQPTPASQREQIDLSQLDAISHFCNGEYLKWPIGGTGANTDPRSGRYYFGKMVPEPSFCLRSADRGRTWESRPTVIMPPQ